MQFMAQFELKRTIEVDEETKETKDGKEIITKTKVKKEVPVKFYLQKPTRSLKDAGSLYYAATVSEFIKANVLTRAMLRKYLLNVGGVLSDTEKTEVTQLYDDWYRLQNDFTRLQSKEEKTRTPEEKKSLEELTVKLLDIQRRIQEWEQSQATLFESTAENLSKNKTVIWWLVNLIHWDNDKKEPVPFFGNGTTQQRLDKLDEVQEAGDEFMIRAKDEALLYTTIYYEGMAGKQEEFDEVRKRL